MPKGKRKKPGKSSYLAKRGGGDFNCFKNPDSMQQSSIYKGVGGKPVPKMKKG